MHVLVFTGGKDYIYAESHRSAALGSCHLGFFLSFGYVAWPWALLITFGGERANSPRMCPTAHFEFKVVCFCLLATAVSPALLLPAQ